LFKRVGLTAGYMENKQKKTKDLTRRKVLKYGLYGGLATSLSSSLWLSGCSKREKGPMPNIALVLIDTLRPDYLGFYGYKKETAPFLAKIAEQSVVFSRAFATSSWTAPSTASLFTSKYPHQHGVIEGFYVHKFRMTKLKEQGEAEIPINSIPVELPTLPEIFKSIGYTTFGVGANVNIGDEIGFSRGFDQFEANNDAPADVLYERMREWKEKIQTSKPFFLYLHPNDPHTPYLKRQPYYEEQKDQREDMRARYLSEIGYIDSYLEKIYEMLNLHENTIFVVISDHGEEFWDHGDDGHRSKLYRELTQILMMFRTPFSTTQPKHIDTNVSIIDVLPTLVDLVDVKPVKGTKGISLAPLLTKNSGAKALDKTLRERTLYAHRIANAPVLELWAAIYKHWNLIENWNSKLSLFDHRKDLKEKNNVIFAYQNVATQLLSELQEFKKEEKRIESSQVKVNLDDNLMEVLRSLGYVE
jgi:arylsulfatase A-like enzyme